MQITMGRSARQTGQVTLEHFGSSIEEQIALSPVNVGDSLFVRAAIKALFGRLRDVHDSVDIACGAGV